MCNVQYIVQYIVYCAAYCAMCSILCSAMFCVGVMTREGCELANCVHETFNRHLCLADCAHISNHHYHSMYESMAAMINTRSHMIVEQQPYEMQESHMWEGLGPCPVKWA